MSTMRKDDLPSAMLDRLIAQANLRLAWRMRFSDFLHGRLTLTQYSQLQAECFRAFGPRWQEELLLEEGGGDTIALTNAPRTLGGENHGTHRWLARGTRHERYCLVAGLQSSHSSGGPNAEKAGEDV